MESLNHSLDFPPDQLNTTNGLMLICLDYSICNLDPFISFIFLTWQEQKCVQSSIDPDNTSGI
ncbi:hypothetical protein BDQ94DRAFT_147020 [Aspergillus welwitschiae]|uniref:Uncharacterized protein n=1 Tax=Aspergillus welwitschiae TaxID=1341132 RepID=A0A3F3PX72_9EURO|nr:hypothetical protein BDQ94DRAFT_147020 [Aspergillus welwitschiae]RDH31584.1 hypothetical protein BDQ94DRAFT_147020 [Aspergillus welwitschiae]